MKPLYFCCLLFFVLFGIISCDKTEVSEDEMVIKQLFPDSTLVGTWKGSFRQLGSPNLIVELVIDHLTLNSIVGKIKDEGNCNYNIVYLGKLNANTFNFKENLLSGSAENCIGGTSNLKIESKDELTYNWTGDDHPTNTGIASLSRQK